MQSAWDGEAIRGGSCGGDAAERALGAAAWLGCGGGGPARLLGCHGARAQQQLAGDGSLPPCADPGWLTTTAVTAGLPRWRRARVSGSSRLGQRGTGGDVQGRRTALNSSSGLLDVRATHQGVPELDSEAAARRCPGRGRRGEGDDGWVPAVSDSSAARAGKRAGGLVGPAWQAAVLLVCASWRAGLAGVARTSWRAARVGHTIPGDPCHSFQYSDRVFNNSEILFNI
jgi:hypothetical protein